jgi:hypothetical protein
VVGGVCVEGPETVPWAAPVPMEFFALREEAMRVPYALGECVAARALSIGGMGMAPHR